jgi:acetyl-CoA C-acetyltransferase
VADAEPTAAGGGAGPGAVLIGAAQWSLRSEDVRAAPDPLTMLEGVARAAAADAGLAGNALARLDTLGLVDVLGWRVRNGPRLLAERLGAHPARELTSGIGGEAPLVLLAHAAGAIAAGHSRLALVVGGNLYDTLTRARRAGIAIDWPSGGEGTPTCLGGFRPGSSEREIRYGLAMPSDIYPLFENALRARRGLDLAAHRIGMGRLMSRFTDVAARNPHAWFPVARSAEELVTVTAENRMVAFPYPKYLNAVLQTDQAAAVLLASPEEVRALGVPEERLVHFQGGDRAQEEIWFPTERPRLDESPALARAARGALTRAGAELGEIDVFDLYSCFPSAVEMACEMLGLGEDDPRGFTVTGGLPYAGGPGNAYTLHAVAALMDRLRERPGSLGLVTGNGWYLTKHSACVLASRPPQARRAGGPVAPAAKATPAGTAPPRLVEEARGRARIVTYTVVYDRAGAPARGIVVGDLEDGGRFLAHTPDDGAVLEELVTREGVGRAGRVEPRDGRNLLTPD